LILYYFLSAVTVYVFSKDIKIVPILIGNLSQAAELEYGDKIAPFLAQEGTIVIVSSDFCHWFVVGLPFVDSTHC